MPEDELVLEQGAPEKAAPKEETVTLSKAEFDRLGRELNETKASERYWADKARGGKEAPAADPDEDLVETSDLLPKPVSGTPGVDEAIFSDPDKWLEAIAKGPKAIEALVRKQGYVNADQVAEIAAKVARRTVDVERQKIGTDNKLMTTFPELADKESELFRETAKEYQELIQFDPRAKNSPATLYAAAKAAKSRLQAAAPKRRADDDEEEYGSGYDRAETERRARVRAQDGSRNGRGPRAEEEEDSLGPQARQIAKMMGITEQEMLAEKKKTDALRRKR